MRKIHTVALAAAAAFAANPAFAEDDIVVTATRGPVSAERLPARVERVGREDIETLALSTLAEALGPQAVQAGGAGQQTSLFLRGANSKHALALFDGVRLNDASTPNAQYDFGADTLGGIERIEVLRGPASTVYGSDAIGGVVNLLPRRGGETAFEPFLEAAAGSHETRRFLLGAAGATGGFSYGLSAESFATAGYDLVPARIAGHTGDADPASIDTLTASARHESGAFGVDALLRLRESRAEFDTFSGGACFCQRADDADLANDMSQSLWRLGADLSEGALEARFSGGQVRSDRAETDDGFETSAAESTRDFADLTVRYDGDRLDLTAGLAYERNAIDTRPQYANPLSVEEDQLGAYIIAQAQLADALIATASARRDDYEAFGEHGTYALGLVWSGAHARVFAAYGTAFKAPSLSERFEQSFFNVGNPDLNPETSRSWEIGGDLALNDALSLGASYYETRIRDLIEYNFPARRNLNVGRADIDGAELYADFAPAAWASLRVTYAWTDAVNAATGVRLARRPEHAWRLDARVAPTDRLSLTLSWNGVGERLDVTYDNAGDFLSVSGRVDAYAVGAFSAEYALDAHATLFARIDNVSDETYEQPAAFAGAPRTAQVGVRAKF